MSIFRFFEKFSCKLGFHEWDEWKPEDSCIQERMCKKCPKKEHRESHKWSEWIYQIPEPAKQAESKKRLSKQKEDAEEEYKLLCAKLSELRKGRIIESEPAQKFKLNNLIEECESEIKTYDERLNNLQNSLLAVEKEDGSCLQIRKCERCGEEQERIKHEWSDEHYESPISCRLVKYCQRCGIEEFSEKERHIWGNWDYESPTSCRQIRFCRRCGKKEIKAEEEHKWDDWSYESSTSCYKVRVCQHCHEKQKSDEEFHNWGEWRKDSVFHDKVKRVCSRCKKEESGNYLVLPEFYQIFTPIQEYIEDHLTNERYIKKNKTLIINSMNEFAVFQNNFCPEAEITAIRGIRQILEITKKSPDEDLRTTGIEILLKMRRFQLKTSEDSLKIVFTIAMKDESLKVRKAAELALQQLEN